jgi:hypothetical protein
MRKNLVIHRVLNKGRSDILRLINLQTVQSFLFQDFPESFASPAALLVEVKASVQHAEGFLRMVYPRQFVSKPGMASQFPSDKNPVSLIAFA